jgi:molybdenum cofactor cytidylyltransferase
MSRLPREGDCRVAGVVLAAGTSSRFGRVKQLLPFRKTTLLGQVIENATRSLLHEVVVVLGHGAKEIQNAMSLEGTNVAINQGYEQGQSTSLRVGLSAVSGEADGVMFLLGDQPLVGPAVMNVLIDGYCRTRAPILLPTYRNKRGNPVVIDRVLFPSIESLMGDVGARVLFEEYAEEIVEVEMEDDSIHLDLDTWEDYEELKRRSAIREHTATE